jgi:cell division protein FtsZ
VNITTVNNELGRIRVKVIGVGNAGGMMVKRIARERLPGVECGVINTAIKDLESCPEIRALQIGIKVTHGTGTGSEPSVGARSAQEDADRIRDFLGNNDVVFLVAGFGKGTGTGATPVVADLARSLGSLTVAFVTRPFAYEGAGRAQVAEEGIRELAGKTDVFVPLPNQSLMTIMPGTVALESAFGFMDEAILMAIRGMVDVLMKPGRINLDLADMRSLLKNTGHTAFGVGVGKGESRMADALHGLEHYPFLTGTRESDVSGMLISITGGTDLGAKEVEDVVQQVRGMVGGEPRLAFAINVDETLQGEMRVMMLAAGLTEPVLEPEQDMLPVYNERKPAASSSAETLYRPERLARHAIPAVPEPSLMKEGQDKAQYLPAYMRRPGKNGSPQGRG